MLPANSPADVSRTRTSSRARAKSPAAVQKSSLPGARAKWQGDVARTRTSSRARAKSPAAVKKSALPGARAKSPAKVKKYPLHLLPVPDIDGARIIMYVSVRLPVCVCVPACVQWACAVSVMCRNECTIGYKRICPVSCLILTLALQSGWERIRGPEPGATALAAACTCAGLRPCAFTSAPPNGNRPPRAVQVRRHHRPRQPAGDHACLQSHMCDLWMNSCHDLRALSRFLCIFVCRSNFSVHAQPLTVRRGSGQDRQIFTRTHTRC